MPATGECWCGVPELPGVHRLKGSPVAHCSGSLVLAPSGVPDQHTAYDEGRDRLLTDAEFVYRVHSIVQHKVGPAPRIECIAEMLVLDERIRAILASRGGG